MASVRIGIVRSLRGNMALVESAKRGACENCSENGLCFGAGKDTPDKILARNPIGAVTGNVVEVRLAEGAMLKASFFVYLFPLLGMIAGAFLASPLAGPLGVESDTASLLGAVGGFALAMLVSMLYDRVSRGKSLYQPEICAIRTGADVCMLPAGSEKTEEEPPRT